jgi:hypothetical protein
MVISAKAAAAALGGEARGVRVVAPGPGGIASMIGACRFASEASFPKDSQSTHSAVTIRLRAETSLDRG